MIDLEAAGRALNEHPVIDATPAEAVMARGALVARHDRRRRAGIAATCSVLVIAVVGALVVHGHQGERINVAASTSTPSSRATSTTAVADHLAPTPVAQAETLADRLLARVVLPDGAREYHGALPPILHDPFEQPQKINLVDHDKVWTTSQTADAVVSFIKTHVPAGAVQSGAGSSGRYGVIETYGIVITFPGPLPATIASSALVITIAPHDGGGAWLRADGEVVWRDRRAADEIVPATDRVVTVRERLGSAAAPVARSKVVADAKVAADLIAEFNALPVAVPGIRFCPAESSTTPFYELDFSRTATASPDLVAVVGYCGGVTVMVHGQTRPALEAGLLRPRVAALLGVTGSA